MPTKTRTEAADISRNPALDDQSGQQATGAQPLAAPGGWFGCDVLRVGPVEDGKIYIGLRDRGNGWPGARWYSAVPGYRKEMLATALTAISLQLPVSAALTTTDEYGEINRLYIMRG